MNSSLFERRGKMKLNTENASIQNAWYLNKERKYDRQDKESLKERTFFVISKRDFKITLKSENSKTQNVTDRQ